jgi:putative spermidine/putrescine transport system permease protein
MGPVLVFVAIFFLWPVAGLLVEGFKSDHEFSMNSYRTVLTQPLYRDVIVYTYVFTLGITAIVLVMGYFLAYAMATFWKRYTSLIAAVLVLSFWSGMLIRTFAWMVILGNQGLVATALRWLGMENPPELLYNTVGVAIGIINVALPYMVLMLYPVMRNVDPDLVPAARTLGATPTKAFIKVYLPATRSGILSGTALVYMFVLGFYITPALLGGTKNTMVSQIIAQQVSQLFDWHMAGALSAILMVGSWALLMVYNVQLKEGRR